MSVHGLEAELVVRRERELLVLLLDAGGGALQVVALRDFLLGLRDRVLDLGEVHFGDDVEAGIGHGLHSVRIFVPSGGARAKSESGRFGPDIFCVNVNVVRLPAASDEDEPLHLARRGGAGA